MTTHVVSAVWSPDDKVHSYVEDKNFVPTPRPSSKCDPGGALVNHDTSASDALQDALDELDVVRGDLQVTREELSAEVLERQDLQATHSSTIDLLRSAERTILTIKVQHEAFSADHVDKEADRTIANLKAIAQHERDQFMMVVRERDHSNDLKEVAIQERDSARAAWRSTQNALGEAHLRITQLQAERDAERPQPLVELSNDILDLLYAIRIIRCSTQDTVPLAP
jgi:chromosome segregation ATPase